MNNIFNPNTFVYPVQTSDIKISKQDRVCLIDGDGSKDFPNWALQKISAWEKRQGVSQVRLIKLKTQRVNGILGIHPESLADLREVRVFDRVYASFIFTWSKPIIEELRRLIPHAYMGGTGVDEYHEKQERELRAKPRSITKLPAEIQEMYPDFGLYESHEADENIQFWSNPKAYKLPRKAKQMLEGSPNGYGIIPRDLEDNLGGADVSIQPNSRTIETFDFYAKRNGMMDGLVWRGQTRGSGMSSLGCHRKCLFCVIPVTQGPIQPMYYGLLGTMNWVLPIGFYPTMREIVELYQAGKLLIRPHIFREMKNGKIKPDGRIKRISPMVSLSDNNFPADPTCLEKLDWLILNDCATNLNQGIDARLLTAKKRVDANEVEFPSGDEICERLAKLHFCNFQGTARQIHVSWDFIGAKKAVMDGIDKLVHQYGLSYRNFMVYCLSGFDTTFSQDKARVEHLRHLRIDAFIMLFRNVDGSEGTNRDGEPHDWRLKHLTRWANKKMLFRKIPFEKYESYMRELKQRENPKREYVQLELPGFYSMRDELRDLSNDYREQLSLFDWLTEEYITVA